MIADRDDAPRQHAQTQTSFRGDGCLGVRTESPG